MRAINLDSEIPKGARLGFWPFVDLCAIGLFFALFSSKFVMAPGITLALPEVDNPQVAISPYNEVVSISEVKGEEMIFFQDSVLNLESFARYLEKRGGVQDGTTLLVRADARVTMQTLSSLSEIAMRAGYAKVQLAAEAHKDRSGNPSF